MLTFLMWLVLAIVSLPLAIPALLLSPIVWLLSIPFPNVGISMRGALELIEGIVRLPGRLLGGGRR